ncbi:MAG TPA: hypothetical protein EYQ74_09140 [Planctomycetes bacterium]|nr:hypothetical protein [Planctomycetota bacterium]
MESTPLFPLQRFGAVPRPGAALVVARWNAWARLWFPETGEAAWVNLDEFDFTPLTALGQDCVPRA